MSSALAMARANAVCNKRLAEWESDKDSKYIKAYRQMKSGKLPATSQSASQAQTKPVPKNLSKSGKAAKESSSSKGSELTKEQIEAFVRRQMKEKAKKLAAQMAQKDRSRSASTSTRDSDKKKTNLRPEGGTSKLKPSSESKKGEKDSRKMPSSMKPRGPVGVESFEEVMRMAAANEAKVAASNYTRSPSPQPRAKPGPASFKRRAETEAIHKQAAKVRRRSELEKARADLGFAPPSSPPKDPKAKAKIGPASFKAAQERKEKEVKKSFKIPEGLSSSTPSTSTAAKAQTQFKAKFNAAASARASLPSTSGFKTNAEPKPKLGPASWKSTKSNPVSSNGMKQKEAHAASSKPSEKKIGEISAAAKARLQRMNGRKMEAQKINHPMPSSSAMPEKNRETKPKSSSVQSHREEELRRRKLANARAEIPQPTFGLPSAKSRPPPNPQPSPAQIRQAAINDMRRAAFHAYDEEEEEMDSDLDDFIDDTPMSGDESSQGKMVRSAIREVFRGYDSRKFAGEKWSRDDDRAMQASFKDVQKEERKSAIAGAREDHQEFLREKAQKSKRANPK